ncbi:MAG: hypothetical protein ACOYNW_09350 [Undibacterium curvum]|uniref:hypothetical protein n=1 Tax=Undibacterium curvum TaxID=2762294 RepID=UPI003BED50C8
MSEFRLAAGSKVKFGCTTNQLYTILRLGISNDTQRLGLENHHLSGGIFVGELMAYYAACAAFCKNTSELHQQHAEVMGAFVNALQEQKGSKPVLAGLDDIGHQAGLPVVLDIELGEDCLLLADPQFVAAHETEKSWKYWRSASLQRPDGIPASWVRQVFFPRLLDFRDVATARSARSLEQTTDCALMVGGLMQAWHKDAPADLLHAFHKQYGRINFSQSMNFDETSLERFFNLAAMIDPASRLLNQMTIWQDIDALAKKQGIPLSE